MKRFALTLVLLLVLSPLAVLAQNVVAEDSFSNMGSWQAGHGEWFIENGRLVQADTETGLARIDRRLPQRGTYQIDFIIRYRDGGYESRDDLENLRLHGGFGVHVGVTDPPLGRATWGNGESYLLWLNLDTRADTRRNSPEHYGFRAQVYESTDNSTMALWETSFAERYFGDSRMSIDLVEALENYGVEVTLQDGQQYLVRDIPVSIRVDTETGRIGVKDPTAPIRFYFDVDPDILEGDYISLRTNSLGVEFDDFVVTRR
ncbi:MAG: hypothetical protein ACOCYG_03345 [Spirochaetota bacterium]